MRFGLFVALGAAAFCAIVSGGVRAEGILGTGQKEPLPKSESSGAAVDFSVWDWPSDKAARKEAAPLSDGARLEAEKLPAHLNFRFHIHAPHDNVRCVLRSSDSFDKAGWGPEQVKREGSDAWLYRTFAESSSWPPQVGRYYIEVEATDAGKSVARRSINFEIFAAKPPPRGTHYTQGKTDSAGHPITTSAQVVLDKLNESPELKDNDYAFEPQHAFNAINFERFPPFHLPPRFVAVWNTRRFSDEDKFGGPLNRGFNSQATVQYQQDNLLVSQRAWFHTPDQQVAFINEWYKKDPKKYFDLKTYADHRLAFVSAENAYQLGWRCYESWGAGHFGPYDAGLYGWDEEQMWPTILAKELKEHPDQVPERFLKEKEADPQLKDPGTLHRLQMAYIQAWGDFIAEGYRGARDCAAKHGRTFKIWHYGSKAPGEHLFLNREDGDRQPNGKFKYEEMSALFPWFQKNGKIDFAASAYAREIDYFHKDFYYHTLFPEQASMYLKDANGKYALDKTGRRQIRRDVIEETNYVEPVKVGQEDYEIGPVFLKSHISKGENALFFFNGGKYYKQRGTLITDKQMIPALRPGNQETWGDCAKFGSRPVNPYLAEAAAIYTFMIGLEGLYYWDARGFTGPIGYGRDGDTKQRDTLGDIELAVKGLHRVSHFNALFEGTYSFVRPTRHYQTYNREHPIIRGILNGRYLVLAMTNPYLDPGETQAVEVWYDAPAESKDKGLWSQQVKLLARKTHLFQCKLPELPNGQAYDPDRLYFRYTCEDGNFKKTFTVTGNYDVPYPHAPGVQP